MNSDLVKLKVKSDVVIDTDIQNEIIRLQGSVNNLETLLKSRFNTIEISSYEILKTILKRLYLSVFGFYSFALDYQLEK